MQAAVRAEADEGRRRFLLQVSVASILALVPTVAHAAARLGWQVGLEAEKTFGRLPNDPAGSYDSPTTPVPTDGLLAVRLDAGLDLEWLFAGPFLELGPTWFRSA